MRVLAACGRRHDPCYFVIMNAITTYFRRASAKVLRLLCLLPALCGYGYSWADESQTTPEQLVGTTQGFLEYAVEQYLKSSGLDERYEIEVSSIDPRLRLTACSNEDLDASLQSPAQPIGRVNVKVSCTNASPWTVYVPAQVHLFRDVVMVTRPLKRGETLSGDDVAMVERDIGQLNQSYLTAADQAVGYTLTRPVVADQVLTPGHLEQTSVVQKGDQVVIVARSGAINVRMPGEAMNAGSVGEQIRVRNLTSERVIKARVTGPGSVEVAM
jgi:flagella basal body P-ring formation protein FlgA